MTRFWRRDGDDLLLSIRLSPRASSARIGGCWTDAKGQTWMSASVTAPPDKGRANMALIELLGEALGIARSSISLEAGDTSRLKRVRIKFAGADIVEKIEGLT